MVITLEQHAVQLFMAVLFQGFEPDAPRVSDAETTQALAFVAMMFNATYVVSKCMWQFWYDSRAATRSV